MCGIIAYIGDKEAGRILVDGLKRLEYRGYDSAGVAIDTGDGIAIKKGAGRVDELNERLGFSKISGKRGIAQTRWATHGEPNDVNAHPHTDCSGRIALVHNGIIENYLELKEALMERGHTFKSETDTEVIAHLIEEELKSSEVFEEALRRALLKLRGSFALAIIYEGEKDRLYLVRNESPLVLGIGEGENFAASDVPAFLEHTSRAVFLDDGEYAVIGKDFYEVKRIEDGRTVEKEVTTINWTLEMAEKAGYPHFMLKEIYEQPQAIKDAIYGNMETIGEIAREVDKYEKVFIVAMGTSYHAGLYAKYLFQHLLGKVVVVEEASEFRYSAENVLDENTLVMAITQSGETADTLAAIKLAREKGAKVLSVVNVVGSMATRLSDMVIYTHAGPEIGVAATKTYTTQLTVMALLAMAIAELRGTDISALREALLKVPDLVEEVLKHDGAIKELSESLREAKDFFYIGRSFNVPTALEGALKLKEISYIHAEGLSAGELKHGPLALIEEGVPVVAIAPSGRLFEKMVSNIKEVSARRGFIIALGDSEELKKVSNLFIEMPSLLEELTPIVYAVPLQLLAYHLAVLRGNDPDKPRNLAKSVTVE